MAEETRIRRRIESEPEDTGGRSGCLWVAAILGIVIGVPAGLFGLPALLNHYFGENTIASGEAYDHEGLRVAVGAVTLNAGEGVYEVTLLVEAEEGWDPAPVDFELEVAGGERIPALPPEPTDALTFEKGSEASVILRFGVPEGAPEPDSLLVAPIGARFELTPEP